jgi:hypothetical protein
LTTIPLKNDGVKVSWDDDYSQLNGKIKVIADIISVPPINDNLNGESDD